MLLLPNRNSAKILFIDHIFPSSCKLWLYYDQTLIDLQNLVNFKIKIVQLRMVYKNCNCNPSLVISSNKPS